MPYLFLYPEYLGSVDMWSHLIMGFALGGFIMAFNMYTYVMHGSKFPFLATLSRPFLKFCINNFILPGVFVLTFMYSAITFQLEKEFLSGTEVFANMVGLVSGLLLFFVLSLFYFFRTNKDIFKLTGKRREQMKEAKSDKTVANVLHKRIKWYHLKSEKGWLVVTYLSHPFKVALARDSSHYDNDILQRVFIQNHINASIFEIVMLVSFLVLGSFRDVGVFQIPAGASVLLLFTMVLMLISACYSWFKGWTAAILITFLVLINVGSTKYEFLRLESHAFGMNYETEKVEYTSDALRALRDDKDNYKNDKAHMIEILHKWRLKNERGADGSKPKLVIISTSGGGLRSTLWTVHCIQHLDSVTGNKLLMQTPFMTGSSGGMIGAAYMRELYLRKMTTDTALNLYDQKYADNVSQDILNPVGFSIATNDMFIRYQTCKYGEYEYPKDRAYAFEQKLSRNVGGVMDKRVMDYKAAEDDAIIPVLLMAPSIVNDGRRLLISSQNVSYLANNVPDSNVNASPLVEDVEFMRLFKNQDAANLQFMTALRMNATFPYILPTVNLPSEPSVEVMDAGLRDNFGMKATLQYLYTFRNWISTNTSGVVIIQIRDKEKDFEVENGGIKSMFSKLLSPLGSVYGNFTTVQDYSHDQMIQHMSAWFDGEVDIVPLALNHDKNEPISMSFHLTAFEKRQILRSIYLTDNVKSIERLKELLGD